MSTLFLILVAPLLLSGITSLLRRWPRTAAWIAAGSTALLALAIWLVAPGGEEAALQWEPLGLLLIVDAAIARLVALLFGGSALVLGLAAVWPQGRDFSPALLAALAPLSLALMVRPFVYGAVALVIASTILAALIQAGRASSTLAATRYLTVMVLMAPFFLAAGWLLDSEQLIFLRTLWRLLLVGFALLLAGFPFHFWLRPLLEEATPLAVVVVLGLSQLVLVAYAGIVIGEHPVLGQTEFGSWLRLLGAGTMAAAALLLLAARQVDQAIAYGVLLDSGVVLATLGSGSTGLSTAFSLVLARAVALLLVILAWQLLRQMDLDGDQPISGGRAPWLPLLLGYGAFSLVGLPLTPGFAARWQAIALLGEQSPGLALLAVLAVAAAATGMWRALPHPALPRAGELLDRQRWALPQIIAAALLLAALLLALFPEWLPVLAAVAGAAA